MAKLSLSSDLHLNEYNDEKIKILTTNVIRKIQENNPNYCASFAYALGRIIEDDHYKLGYEKSEKIAIYYFSLLTDAYGLNLFMEIYNIIKKKFECANCPLEVWGDLFIKCLRLEQHSIRQGCLAFIYVDILQLLFDKLGFVKFIEAVQVLSSFPQQVILQNIETLLPILVDLIKSGSIAKENKEAVMSVITEFSQKYPTSAYREAYRELRGN